VAKWRKAVFADSTGQPVRWVEGRCLSYATSTAHHLSTDVLRGLIRAPAGASEEETQETLRLSVKALCSAPVQDVYPFLAHLLGLTLEEDMAARVKYLDGPALQNQYIAAYTSLLRGLAQTVPTIVVCEDTHWADPSSVEIVSQFAERPHGAEFKLKAILA
jgi:predicted ATPase